MKIRQGNYMYTWMNEYLSYAPKSGVITWIKSPDPRVPIGSVATNMSPDGYLRLSFKRVTYPLQCVAWYLHTGNEPKYAIDHKNGVRTDNTFTNLRECTAAENAQNRCKPSTNTSGVKGVSWCKNTNKWKAEIWANRKSYFVGRFGSIDGAKAALDTKRVELHKEFANAG